LVKTVNDFLERAKKGEIRIELELNGNE